MHDIICPHCSKAFKVDEAGYADILKQVRDGEFEQQLHDRLELAERDKKNALALAEAQAASALQKAATAKDTEIQALKAKIDAGELARKLAVTEALSAAGIRAEMSYRGNLRRRMERANRIGARAAAYGCSARSVRQCAGRAHARADDRHDAVPARSAFRAHGAQCAAARSVGARASAVSCSAG
jgi:energy-converting hydrogenase A subunit M